MIGLDMNVWSQHWKLSFPKIVYDRVIPILVETAHYFDVGHSIAKILDTYGFMESLAI